MKRALALMLALILMLPCALAAADGAMTDKAINFAEFSFGDTFGNIRNNVKIGSLDFKYGVYTSRCIADAIDTLPDYVQHNRDLAPCFRVRFDGDRKVASYDATPYMWFAYPTDHYTADNDAVFYAGEYEFQLFDKDPVDIFNDLKEKLTTLYGEPFYAGNDISVPMGVFEVEDINRYTEDTQNMQPEYAVWKSSANNTVVVLKKYTQYGNWNQVRLAYISDVADATFAQVPVEVESISDSLEGL